MIPQSKRILETQAKEKLEEVYSEEEGPPEFEIDEYPLNPILDLSPARPLRVVLSGWNSQTQSKKDKSFNESPNKLARSTLWNLGENIESYHKNSLSTNPEQSDQLTSGDHSSFTRRNHLSSATNRLLQQTSNTMPCPTRSNSISFINGQSERAMEYEQNSQRNALLLQQNIHSKQIPLKKFHLDYSMYRMRFRSTCKLDEQIELGLSNRDVSLTLLQQDTSQRIHHLPLAQVLKTDVHDAPSDINRKQRATSAIWSNKCIRIINDSSSKIINISTLQKQSDQSKMFPFSNIDSDLDEHEQQKNLDISSSTEQNEQKDQMKKRINLFKRSFQTDKQAQSRLFSQCGDNNTVLIGKGFQIPTHSIHNIKTTLVKNNTNNEQKQEIPKDQMAQIVVDTPAIAMVHFPVQTKRLSLPSMSNMTRFLETSEVIEKQIHSNSSKTQKHNHQNKNSAQNCQLDLSMQSFDNGSNNNNSMNNQLSSTRSGLSNLKRGNSQLQIPLSQNSNRIIKRQSSSSIASTNESRNATASSYPIVISSYETHKSFKQFNIPITLRSHIQQKRFDIAKKTMIGQIQQPILQGEKSYQPSIKDEKVIKNILKQNIFRNEELKPVLVSTSQHQQHLSTSQHKICQQNSQERVDSQNKIACTKGQEQRLSQTNRIVGSVMTPFRLQQSSRPSTSASDARISNAKHRGCIQNNFLYQKILKNS